MSHTNSTTNYSLPQFVTTDKPAWLTDVNNAYSAIDTGMHNAQTKANTADSNATQALTDAANAATAAAAADAKGAGAVASIADAFDTTTVYSVGELVMYNSLLYVCSVAIITPGPWTGSANWTRITVESITSDIKDNDLIKVGGSLSCIGKICAGISTSSGTRMRMFIPSAKVIDAANISSAAITGTTFRIYHSGGSVQVAVTDGTWNFTIRQDGVLATINLENAIAVTGNTSVYFDETTTITFS